MMEPSFLRSIICGRTSRSAIVGYDIISEAFSELLVEMPPTAVIRIRRALQTSTSDPARRRDSDSSTRFADFLSRDGGGDRKKKKKTAVPLPNLPLMSLATLSQQLGPT